MNIEQRITELKAELHDLTKRHDAIIAEHNRTEQEFNTAIVQSQNRYQQLAGAIAELELMQREKSATANGEVTRPKNRLAR
jgi:phage shock protein A